MSEKRRMLVLPAELVEEIDRNRGQLTQEEFIRNLLGREALPSELLRKIDENRGDLSRAEFIDFLLESHLSAAYESPGVSREEFEALRDSIKKVSNGIEHGNYATKDEFSEFQRDIKELLKSFIDFALNYGIEFGQEIGDLDKLASGLKDEMGEEGPRVKLKWK